MYTFQYSCATDDKQLDEFYFFTIKSRVYKLLVKLSLTFCMYSVIL